MITTEHLVLFLRGGPWIGWYAGIGAEDAESGGVCREAKCVGVGRGWDVDEAFETASGDLIDVGQDFRSLAVFAHLEGDRSLCVECARDLLSGCTCLQTGPLKRRVSSAFLAPQVGSA